MSAQKLGLSRYASSVDREAHTVMMRLQALKGAADGP